MAENLTTPEQREALEKAGWTLLDETTFTDSPETSWEAWAAPDRRTVGTVYGDREPDVYGLRDVMGDDERPIPANARFAAEFASILGITPSQQAPDGYVLVPAPAADYTAALLRQHVKDCDHTASVAGACNMPDKQTKWTEEKNRAQRYAEQFASALSTNGTTGKEVCRGANPAQRD